MSSKTEFASTNAKQKRKFNFTKKAIDQLEPPASGKQVYYRDTQVRGLALSVAKGGTKSFHLYRRVDGKPQRVFLGYFPDMTHDQARAKAEELNTLVAKGVNPADHRRFARSEPTLREAFGEYIERHAKEKRKTWRKMLREFDLRAGSIAGMQLSKITPTIADKLHHQLKDERGLYAANRCLQQLRAVYNKAIKFKIYSGENPFTGIELFKEKPRQRFLTKDEAVKLLKILDKETSDVADFLKLSLFTGARRSALLSVRWESVDLKAGTLQLIDGKNGENQTISLGKAEIAILKARQKLVGTEFVFPGEGETGHLVEPKKTWYRIRKAAGIPDVTIHDLRRSLGSAMANANVSATLIKNTLGHKDIKTTLAVYALTSNEAEREARELVQRRWREKEPDQKKRKQTRAPKRRVIKSAKTQKRGKTRK